MGFEAALAIAKHANLVIITGYNAERSVFRFIDLIDCSELDSNRLRITEEAIKKDVPTANIRCLALDLGSFAAIRKSAAEVNTYPEHIHVRV